jgi:hypothetical protein
MTNDAAPYDQQGKRQPSGIVNLKTQLDEYFGNHRSGWAFAVKSLAPAHDPRGIYLNTFAEKTFCGDPRLAVAISEPWIGIIHIPPGIPDWFLAHQSNDAMFATDAWQKSLTHCRGIYTLSQYHKSNLEKKLDVPIAALLHPTEVPPAKWSLEAFERNPDKCIVQVGWYLRVLHSIFELPDTGMQKIFLRATNEPHLNELMAMERQIRKWGSLFDESMYKTARVLNFLPNEQYDQLLSQNIVFLNLYDASANNAIIECMARNTPVLVNPLEAVREYLGEDYPLYFSCLEEAAEKARDYSLLFKAHKYLESLPIKSQLTGQHFLESLLNSDIFRAI